MAVIDLTLNSFKVPAIDGYTPPFGTMVTRTEANKGGLSTVEVNSNVMMPFANMRPKVVTEDSTTTAVEYDARIMFTAASGVTPTQGYTLTLGAGAYAGCRLSYINELSYPCKLTYGATWSRPVAAGESACIEWTGSAWRLFGSDRPGMMKTFAGSMSDSNSEPGWIAPVGQQLNVADYTELYAKLGTSHNLPTDNDPTKFRLPDMRECVVVGVGKNTTRIFDNTEEDPATHTAGTQSHDEYTLGQFKDDQFQGHFHKGRQVGNSGSTSYYKPEVTLNASPGYGNYVLEPTTDGTNGTPRYGTTTHGKQVGLHYLLKY